MSTPAPLLGRSLGLLRQAGRPHYRRSITRSCLHAARQLHTNSPRHQTPKTQEKNENANREGSARTARAAPLSLLLGGGLLASAIAISQSPSFSHDINHHDAHSHDQLSSNGLPRTADNRDPSLPRYRLSEIRQDHGPSSSHPWVTYRDKVYDITDWVPAHPGGDVILRAAGGSIEPYWDIFSIHKKSPQALEILEQYLVGYISAEDLTADGRPSLERIEDPFQDDPVRDPRFIVHTSKPRNAEPPNDLLLSEFKTPSGLFYIRNHMWVPVVDETKADEEFVLSVELPSGETRQYTLGDLKSSRFQKHKVTAVLQCSGNRRNDMTRHAGMGRTTNGLQWGVGAIGNAEWEGVRLGDVLADAGLRVSSPSLSTTTTTSSSSSNAQEGLEENAKALHVQFTGAEAYGASIPLTKALDPSGDVLLAFGMNGQTLPRDHGFPLRAIVPGNVAARSVKWLSKIVVSDEESHSQWQRRDYKSFGPNVGANPDWDKAKSIQEMPVTSAITGVWVGECVRKGRCPTWAHNKNGSRDGNGVTDIAAQERVIGYTPIERFAASPSPSLNTKDAAALASTGKGMKNCPDQTPPSEPVAMQGYAYSGGGRAIARVDVSLDGGKTWDQAELVDDCATSGSNSDDDKKQQCYGNKTWTWTRWRYRGELPVLAVPPSASSSPSNPGDSNEKKNQERSQREKYCTTLIVKATDEAYNAQPETHAGIYNVRGNLATAWHQVRICPTCSATTTSEGGGGKSGGGVKWSTGQTYGCGFGKEEMKTSEK